MNKNHLLVFFCLLGGVQAMAGYPTQWTISNRSGENVFLECESLSLYGLPPSEKARIEPTQIFARTIYTHTFSSWWYNDGLGLNAGNFHCAVSKHGRPLEDSAFSVDFRSDWGENVQLIIGSASIIKR